MAAILPTWQQFVRIPSTGQVVGIHLLTLVSTSDTITVPTLASGTANNCSDQMIRTGDATVTVTDNGNKTVTMVGAAGNKILVVTAHASFSNFGAEA